MAIPPEKSEIAIENPVGNNWSDRSTGKVLMKFCTSACLRYLCTKSETTSEMRRIFFYLMAVLCAMSCQKYDDTQIKKDISDLQAQVASLKAWCSSSQSAIDAVATLRSAVEGFNGISYVETFSGNGGTGYNIGLDDGQEITVYNVKVSSGEESYLGVVNISESSIEFVLTDGSSIIVPRIDATIRFGSYEKRSVKEGDVIELIVSPSFVRSDYLGISAEIISEYGVAASVATKGGKTPGWKIEATGPEFGSDGKVTKNPSVTVLETPGDSTDAILRVTLVDNAGCNHVTSVSLFSDFREGPAVKTQASHVILLGFDGMAAAYFHAEDLPAIKSLMDEGCWTLKKRSVLPSSSAINWASMFMGVGTELHGYTEWNSETPEIEPIAVNERGISPTIFSLLREQRPDSKSGCLYEWGTIKSLIDFGAVDYTEEAEDEVDLGLLAVDYIKNEKPNLLAVCWDHPDHEGHNYSWGGAVYLSTMKKLDKQVANVIQATKDAGIYDETVFIVTADHGGTGFDHGGITLKEMETPFIIAGKNIRKGGEIEDSMMQYDVAATIAGIFELEIPQFWVGRPVSSVFVSEQ